MELTAAQIKTYQENGALVVPNVFTTEFMEESVEAFEGLLTQFAADCKIPRADYVSVISQVRDLWKYHPLFEKMILDSVLPQIAAQLMGRPAARLLHDHIISKPLEKSGEVPWHQDYPYWPVDHDFGLSCWLAMDDVDEDSGALEIIPGSHLRGEEAPVDFIQGQRKDLNESKDRVRLAVNKGDVVVLHSLTWHRTSPNLSRPNRRAYISLWIPPESRYAPLHADWHPVNYNVTVEPGAMLNKDWFPVVGNVTEEELVAYPAGRARVNDVVVEDADLSMFNASITVRKRLQELLKHTGVTAPEILTDVHGYLLEPGPRHQFIQNLVSREIVTQSKAASECLYGLAINAIAWRNHKARNVYNAGYLDFQEYFG